jgi:hypothetical protein
MRWYVLVSIGRWQLLVGRCQQCGWPKVAVVRDGVMREWPTANKGEPCTEERDGGAT